MNTLCVLEEPKLLIMSKIAAGVVERNICLNPATIAQPNYDELGFGHTGKVTTESSEIHMVVLYTCGYV